VSASRRERPSHEPPRFTYGERFADALAFAAECHAAQARKGNGVPYVTHVLAVASFVGEFGGDEDQAIAGLLHDTMEDSGVTAAELAARFGARVASIVEACTDTTEHPKPPWRERKERHVAHLRAASADVKLVVAADKLHNMQSIARDLRRRSVGAAVWSRFRASREDTLWYFGAMIDALADGYDGEIVDELRAELARLG
jgi:(p)ppGpp synthase/HD superfamily hydrolase